MSVTSVTVASVTGGVGEDGERRYIKTYRVLTNSANDGPLIVQSAAGVERYGFPYSYGNESDAGAIAVEIDAALERDDASHRVWLVPVVFKTQSVSGGETSLTDRGARIDHPLKRPVIWTGSFVEYMRQTSRDADGEPMRNSANDLLPVFQRDDSRPQITAQKNLARLDLATWASYRDTINEDRIWGLAPKTLKVKQISWQTERWGRLKYFVVSYVFEVNFSGWRESREDVGWRAWSSASWKTSPASYKLTRITDDDGFPLVDPTYLDGNGQKLSEARVLRGDYKHLTFDIYKARPFKRLGLPSKIEP